MSKKKMPRAVMTLKDFHGGSIPSDLPLPSAPGMTVDRSAYERQGSGAWSSPSLGRGYGGNDRGVGHFRQGSANGVRTFEDKASFFPNPANIGRNYEEDERKPVDGRPRSGHADRYEDHGYEDQRPHSSYEKTVDRFSVEEQGSYAPNARTYGLAADTGSYGQGDGQGYRQQSASAYITEQVPPGGRNQSSYTQASQQNLLRARPASPPSNWRQQLQQPPAAATATRSAGPNVWPARQDGINTRTAEPTQNENKSAAPWRASITAARSDVASVEKAPQGRWQSEPDRQVPGHGAEVNLVRGSEFSDLGSRRAQVEPSAIAFVSDRAHVLASGPSSHVAQTAYLESSRASHGDTGREIYMESAPGTYSDAGRRPYGDGYGDAGGRVYQEPSRGGYVDDVGRRRINDERSLGYDEPLRSGNSERITFSDSGRTVYPDSVRYGGEPNRVVDYPENGRRDFRDQPRPEYVESGRERESVDNNRGGYSEASRGSQDRNAFNERGRPGYGSVRGNYGENPQASSIGSGRSGYSLEGARDSYGPVSTRGSYSGEGAAPGSYPRESGYGVDSTATPYGENQDRSRSPYVSNGSRSPPLVDGNRGGYSSSDSGPADNSRGPSSATPAAERPRLKLLPRSKPLETAAPAGAEAAVPEESLKERVPEMEEKRPAEVLTLDGTKSEGRDGGESSLGNSPSNEDLSRPVERPKLNLKPRSQAAEPNVDLDGSGNVRQTVFGGARPRELVLKERGVDDPIVLDTAPTPIAAIPIKPERQESGRTEVSINWGEEKQEATRRYEPRGARSMEKQSAAFPERQDGNRVASDPKEYRRGDIDRQDIRDRYEGNRSYDRQESRTRDGQDSRRDIDKQDSWRRPASPPTPVPNPPALESTNRQNSGRLGYTAPASALELAQAFSRSTSLGTPIVGGMNRTNSGNQRGPVSPGIRPGQNYGSSGYHAGSMNGSLGGYPVKDAPFSRLAEAPALPAPSYTTSGGQGNDFNGYNGGNRGHGSGLSESNWGPSYGRSDDDFPGKRGLPLRRPYE